jgi:hypothetical protein
MSQSVHVRCIRIGYELINGSIRFLADEMAEMHQQLLDTKCRRDGSILKAGCMEYSSDRHHTIAKGIGTDAFLFFPSGQAVAEHCGDVQQMVQLFDKQVDGMQEYVISGVVGQEGGLVLLLYLWFVHGIGARGAASL